MEPLPNDLICAEFQLHFIYCAYSGATILPFAQVWSLDRAIDGRLASQATTRSLGTVPIRGKTFVPGASNAYAPVILYGAASKTLKEVIKGKPRRHGQVSIFIVGG